MGEKRTVYERTGIPPAEATAPLPPADVRHLFYLWFPLESEVVAIGRPDA